MPASLRALDLALLHERQYLLPDERHGQRRYELDADVLRGVGRVVVRGEVRQLLGQLEAQRVVGERDRAHVAVVHGHVHLQGLEGMREGVLAAVGEEADGRGVATLQRAHAKLLRGEGEK